MATKTKTQEAKVYRKEQILKSKQFSSIDKDFLQVILEDEKRYTLQEAKDLLNQEKQREVK